MDILMDVALSERKVQTARAERIGWMVDELDRSRKETTEPATRSLVVRAAAVAAALLGLLLAAPSR